jgi:phosphatidylserine/phosphatidylglycerophosphate/cardiolipin synthase-like enzyme
VAIARTLPAWRGRPGVDEIAKLTLDAIGAAKSLIYLENQYFTSPTVAEALAERLMAPDGPEVLLISSHQSPSYFDRMTMDRTRSVALWRLR